MAYVVGVDIGGTFTDCMIIGDEGSASIGKVSSTPPQFEKGFLDAVRAAAPGSMELAELLAKANAIYHGCTVGTNALVEERTAEVGLLCTRGHSASISVMQSGGRLRGLPPEYVANVPAQTKPEPLVCGDLIEEIDERIAFDGNVLVSLNRERARRAVDRLLQRGVEAIAISLLWSVANPAHEEALRDIVEELGGSIFVSVSSEVSPRVGEYERTVATVVNALVGPVTSSYLSRLTAELRDSGYTADLQIMSCAGGLIHVEQARRLPFLTIGSGPVAGLIGAGALASVTAAQTNGARRRQANVITADMGGTTFDVGVIRDSEPLRRATSRHGQWEWAVETLDVRSIGSGGGSIVRFDPISETIRVGPESAGAQPGPACYGRGGKQATVTDADLIQGYLDPADFLGGSLELDVEAARAALERVGNPLGMSAEETAAAAARIVDNQMADAIKLASVQQGYDPCEFTLFGYGGAGPVHAAAVAREAGMKRVLIPLGDLASVWSAFGVAASEALIAREIGQGMTHPFDPDVVNDLWGRLEGDVLERMASAGIPRDRIRLERSIDLKYSMQINQLEVAAPGGDYDSAVLEGVIARFESEYERLFGEGTGYPLAGVAATAMRVRGRASLNDFSIPDSGRAGAPADPSAARRDDRPVVWYDQGMTPTPTPIFDGQSLRQGMRIEGPAIVELPDTSIVVGSRQTAEADSHGNFIIDL